MSGSLPALGYKPPEFRDPIDRMVKLSNLRAAEQEGRVRETQLTAAQQQIAHNEYNMAATKALDSAYQTAYSEGEDGQPVIDNNKIIASLTQRGFGSKAPEVLKQYNDWSKSRADLQKTQGEIAAQQRQMAADAALLIKNSGYDPVMSHTILDALPRTPQVDSMRGLIDRDPNNFAKAVDAISLSTDKNVTAAAAASRANTQAAELTAKKPGLAADSRIKERADWAARFAAAPNAQVYAKLLSQAPFDIAELVPETFDPTGKTRQQILNIGRTPQEVSNMSADKLEMQDWLAKNPGKGPSDYLSWKMEQSPSFKVTNEVLLTPEAVDDAARAYAKTRQLPSGFYRSPATLAAIVNRATELMPGGDQATNAADYKASQTALTSVQKVLSLMDAFEDTANKNLDLFLFRTKDIVDTKSPWLNHPLRSLDMKALGSKEQAAVNTARKVALTEISRVLTSTTGTGVVSDSARKEVDELIGKDASLSMIYEAAQILRQDMANRHESYTLERDNLLERIKNIGGMSTEEEGDEESAQTAKPPAKGKKKFSWDDFPVVQTGQ